MSLYQDAIKFANAAIDAQSKVDTLERRMELLKKTNSILLDEVVGLRCWVAKQLPDGKNLLAEFDATQQ